MSCIDERVWVGLAACRSMPPQLWYPERGENDVGHDARRVCQGCEVRSLCREAGIARDEDGIWGGLTKRERRDIVYRRVEVRMEHGGGYRALVKYCQCRRCQAARTLPLQGQLNLRPWPERRPVDAQVEAAEAAAIGQLDGVRLAKVVSLLDRRRRRPKPSRVVTPELGLEWPGELVLAVAA